MRKLVATELVSLDGMMQSSEEWAYSYSNDEMGGRTHRAWPQRTPCCSEE